MNSIINRVFFFACACACFSCSGPSPALRHAEANRRAEVQESRRREMERQRASEEHEEVLPAPAASSPPAAASSFDIAEERARFSAQAEARLSRLQYRCMALAEHARAGAEGAELRDDAMKAAADLKAKVISLQGKMPAVLQVTSDQTWSITRDDLSQQLVSLEEEAAAIEARLPGFGAAEMPTESGELEDLEGVDQP